MELPIFKTKRLILKPLELKDTPFYQKNFGDYEVIKNLSSQVPWPYPEGSAEYFIKELVLPRQGKDRWVWGIFEKINPEEIIGVVDLWREPVPENRGFWLARKHWGKGYMTEAVTPITNYAFDDLGFDKLYLSNAPENLKSRRVKEKQGATFLEIRPAKFVNPDWKETELWELTKVNWKKNNRPNFIGNYNDFIEADNSHYKGSDELLSIGCPIGKILGLKKIGIHIETLPPQRRTSWPHAESLEEEFAYVIQGKPHAWINGFLYELTVGDFVAFPSGTGIAHTFINNTDKDVILLVGGEANKKENKIYYPLHPERNLQMKEASLLWEDHPKQFMGDHLDKPNKV
jgi:ribosomal-protein-alanine N-acetyltransferase